MVVKYNEDMLKYDVTLSKREYAICLCKVNELLNRSRDIFKEITRNCAIDDNHNCCIQLRQGELSIISHILSEYKTLTD